MTANELKDLSDKELMLKFWDAREMQRGCDMALIKNEMNRREREA